MFEGQMIAGKLIPVGALSNVTVQLPAAYTKANGRVTLPFPATYVVCYFMPHVKGTELAAIKYIVNACDPAPSARGDGAAVTGSLTDVDAKLQTAFGVAAGNAAQQWMEHHIGVAPIFTIPFFDRHSSPGVPQGIKTIDFLAVDAKDGTVAAAFDVYFDAARGGR